MSKHLKNTTILAFCLAPFVGGISTTMAIKGLAAAPASHYEMVANAGEWQSFAEEQLSDPAAAQSISDTLMPLKDSVCTMSGLERNEGAVSGSSGKGAVSAALSSSCVGIKAIIEALGDTAIRNSEHRKNVAAQIQLLQDIPKKSDISIFERQAEYQSTLLELKDTLAQSNSENLREKVSAQLAVLSNSVVELETKDTEFGTRQKSAVAGLKSQLEQIQSIVNGFLNESARSRQALEKPADPLSASEAVGKWWPRLLPQILLAVGVDLAILWVAAFLSVSRANLRDVKETLERQAIAKKSSRRQLQPTT